MGQVKKQIMDAVTDYRVNALHAELLQDELNAPAYVLDMAERGAADALDALATLLGTSRGMARAYAESVDFVEAFA